MTHASFGCSDIPKFSQRCVERLVETYEKNCKGSTISHSILEDLKFICKLLTWVDDSIIFSFYRRTCEWAAGEGRFPPLSKCSCQPSCKDWQCPSRAITDTDLKNYQSFIRTETQGYLLTMAQAMVTISEFSSFHIKHFKALSQQLQRKVDSTQLLKSKSNVKLERLVAERPSAEEVREPS